MTEWWQEAYPTAAMLAVKGFPRPLYPPDSPAYDPSIDGPDVEAYKRTISRAGRWQWQTFDQAYSNIFSHGKAGGMVGDSGVEGIQRQAGIQSTGNIGTDTFNFLRSLVIPAGLDNAGQMAMDARSVELINAAFDKFQGKTEVPNPVGPAAKNRLARAQSQIGIKESPPRSNRQKYGTWYGEDGVPWCAIFLTWSDQTGPTPTKSFLRAQKYAYVPYIVSDARLGKNGLSVTSSPQPGDLVCYDWSRDGEFDHIGVFEGGNANNWIAIEGNTSLANQSNGGEVMRRNRDKSQANVVFVRVQEP
jgi:hypothetical protein